VYLAGRTFRPAFFRYPSLAAVSDASGETMTNVHFLYLQLKQAGAAIDRALDSLAAEQQLAEDAVANGAAQPSPEASERNPFVSWEDVIRHYKQPKHVPFVPMKRVAITNVGSFDVPDVPAEASPAATSEYYSGLIDQLAKRLTVVEKQLFDLNQRATQLTQILLKVDEMTCAAFDLHPF
jgi:hypothetical protein